MDVREYPQMDNTEETVIKRKVPGNLLTVIPGVVLCIVTAAFVFLMAIGSNMLLPEEERNAIQEKLHMYEITGWLLENTDLKKGDK